MTMFLKNPHVYKTSKQWPALKENPLCSNNTQHLSYQPSNSFYRYEEIENSCSQNATKQNKDVHLLAGPS